MKTAGVSFLLALVFWFVLFSPWTHGAFNFWLGMSCAAGCLGALAVWAGRREAKELYRFRPAFIVIGVISAAVLYGLFYLGKVAVTHITGGAAAGISGVYALRSQAPGAVIAALLSAWIGPLEEVYWRGFLQRRVGYLAAAGAYAAAHVFSFNPMLIMAALAAGLFWGALFKKYRSVWPGIISHALWDAAIFVLWPLA